MEIALQSVEAAEGAVEVDTPAAGTAEGDVGVDTPAAGTAEAAAAHRTVDVVPVGIDIPGGTAAVGTGSPADTVWIAGTGTAVEAVACTGMGRSILPVSSSASPLRP